MNCGCCGFLILVILQFQDFPQEFRIVLDIRFMFLFMIAILLFFNSGKHFMLDDYSGASRALTVPICITASTMLKSLLVIRVSKHYGLKSACMCTCADLWLLYNFTEML